MLLYSIVRCALNRNRGTFSDQPFEGGKPSPVYFYTPGLVGEGCDGNYRGWGTFTRQTFKGCKSTPRHVKPPSLSLKVR